MGDVDFVVEAVDQASKVLDSVKAKLGDTDSAGTSAAKGLEKTNQALEKQVSAAKKAEGGLKTLKASYTDIMNIARNVSQAMKKAWEFAREGADLDYARIKFERLAESIGTTSDALLNRLRTATKGTASDMQLMGTAADFVGLGLAKTGDQVTRLSFVSAALGMDMNQLVLTLANQTTMRFDQLGVSIDGFDERVKKLKESGMDANEAFTEAFLQQAEAQVEKVGNAADETIGSFQKLEAAWRNYTDAIKESAAETLGPLLEETAQQMDLTARLRAAGLNERDYIVVGKYQKRLIDAAAAMAALGGTTKSFDDTWMAAREGIEGMPSDVFERIFGGLPEAIADLEEAEIQLSDFATALQTQGGGEYKLNFMMDYATQYDATMEKIREKEAELAAARAAGWSATGSHIQGLQGEIDALYAGMDSAAQKIVFDFAMAATLADGIQPGEIEKIMGLGVEMGMWSQEAAGAAVTMWTTFTGEATTAMNTLSADTETSWRNTTDSVVAMLNEIPNKVTVTVEQQGDNNGGGGGNYQGGQEGYASGGHAQGWFWTGDMPGGRLTPHSELVYAPHGARVYSAMQSRAMASSGMPRMAEGGTMGGSREVDLSYASMARLAGLIAVEWAKVAA